MTAEIKKIQTFIKERSVGKEEKMKVIVQFDKCLQNELSKAYDCLAKCRKLYLA